MSKINCAIIGSGNIGTDLMLKIIKTSQSLSLNGVIGIDPESEGLAMAKSHNIPISSSGLQGFMEMKEYQDTEIFFDATSAGAHKHHHDLIINDDDLNIPHPNLHKRPFVFLPLRDLDKSWKHPVFLKTIDEFVKEFDPNELKSVKKIL